MSEPLPLFPLNVVALPGELVPLHIFEERYKAMIAHCLEQDTEFGIVWSDGGDLRLVGCACRVEEVLERLADGRLNIAARGTQAFRLLQETPGAAAWPSGLVEFLDDADEAADEEAGAEARDAYAELVEEATDAEPDFDRIGAMNAYDMAATIDFGLAAKQGLLDLRSETARLRLLVRLLRAALKRIELVESTEERARSNGKVRFGAT